MKRQPVVVIVGRPNVGKSTLFNRLTRSRRSLVHDVPGVTRDRIVGEVSWPGAVPLTLVDTGGLLLEDADEFVPLIRSQADAAIRDADAVLFMVDGAAGPLPEDRDIAEYLRSLGPAVVLVANKGDRANVELQAQEFFSLGLGAPVVISAEHGTGFSELWEALNHVLQWGGEDQDDGDHRAGRDPGHIHVAIIGRPNVGKSSLLNRLVGDARALVSDVPGTTRDAVDEVVEQEGRTFHFVDTAGIRRKGRTDRGPEVLSVVVARKFLEKADLCLLVVDAVEGVTKQDAHVAGYAWEAGRALILVVNKWDLIERRQEARERLLAQMAQHLKFMRHAPAVFLSALTGKGVHSLYPKMVALHGAQTNSTPTSELNRILHLAWERNPPPMAGRKAPKLYYCSQVSTAPPSYLLFTNLTQKVHFSYLRYLENVLREALGLDGVPIQVMIRGRKR